jgi:hypothetical protein
LNGDKFHHLKSDLVLIVLCAILCSVCRFSHDVPTVAHMPCP